LSRVLTLTVAHPNEIRHMIKAKAIRNMSTSSKRNNLSLRETFTEMGIQISES
jgi:hypothetical protein